MYAAMTGASGPIDLTLSGLNVNVPLGAPLAFQTAVDSKVGDFWGTLEWAKENHASSVELPRHHLPDQRHHRPLADPR